MIKVVEIRPWTDEEVGIVSKWCRDGSSPSSGVGLS